VGAKVLTELDQRFEYAGFVYVGDTRVVYGPAYHDKEVIQVSASNWARPTVSEMSAALDLLRETYPDKHVVIR
jgi:hypothetical protein